MVKQRHPSYRTLGELVFKSTEEIVCLFGNWAGRGISLDEDSFSHTRVLDEINFSKRQLGTLEKYMKEGLTLCEEQGRGGDALTYRTLAHYFTERKAKF